MTVTDLTKILNSLSNLYHSGQSEVLLQVLELTLLDIHTVSRARGRGFFDNALKWVSPAAIGAFLVAGISLIEMAYLGNPLDMGSGWLTTLTAFGGWGGRALLPAFDKIRAIPEAPGRMRAFAKRNWQRLFLKGKILNKAKIQLDEEVPHQRDVTLENQNQNSMAGNLSGQDLKLDSNLDIDFDAIKRELKNQNLNGPIAINDWGLKFHDGLEIMIERYLLLSSRVEKISENSQKIQNEQASEGASAGQKFQYRSLIQSQIELIKESLVVAFGIKTDLLSLSAGLDRYNEILAHLEKKRFNQTENAIFESTSRNLSSYKTQISAMANLLVGMEQTMISELNISQMVSTNKSGELILKMFENAKKQP